MLHHWQMRSGTPAISSHLATVQFSPIQQQITNCSTPPAFGGEWSAPHGPPHAALPRIIALRMLCYTLRLVSLLPIVVFFFFKMSLNSPFGPNGYFCACQHLEQQRGSVATVNSCLLNFEAMCWKDAGPSQLSWRAPRSSPPSSPLPPSPPASYSILLKHHRDRLRSSQRVMPSAHGNTLYHLIWRLSLKASLNTSNSPGRGRTWHVCPHYSCYY